MKDNSVMPKLNRAHHDNKLEVNSNRIFKKVKFHDFDLSDTPRHGH